MNKTSYTMLFRRYVWLVDVIYSVGHFSKEEIDRHWTRSSLNDRRENSIPERTFHRHREAAAELFGIIIAYDRLTNTYYIENTEVLESNSMQQSLLSSLSTTNILSDAKQIDKYICFEPVPSGQRYLLPLIEAIRDQRTVKIIYQRFSVVDDGWKLSNNQPNTFLFEPYCLKFFHRRWYVVGNKKWGVRSMEQGVRGKEHGEKCEDSLRIYALDRIQSLTLTNTPYTLPNDFDHEAYFRYCYGVSGMRNKPELIKIKVSEQQANYIRTLPLHPSQQEMERGDEYSIFTFFLVPTFEFQQALWQHMHHLEILAPDWLREEIRHQIKYLYDKYWK